MAMRQQRRSSERRLHRVLRALSNGAVAAQTAAGGTAGSAPEPGADSAQPAARGPAAASPGGGFVIAVSSVSGGGKTTLVKNAARLLDAVALFFDDYAAHQNP